METKDKNLQDDWLTDSVRNINSTSKELPEYGGNLKEIESLNLEKISD